MEILEILEAQLDPNLLDKLISMSADWETENSTYGYRKNTAGDIEPNRIFLAVQDQEILGYLFAHEEKAENIRSIMADQTPYLEIEELYVVPSHRSQGIGAALFRYAEQAARSAGIAYIMLSTATRNYKRILHFYIDELGMDFWSARLFKKLDE